MVAPARTHEHQTSLKFRALDRLGQLEGMVAEALRRIDALEARRRRTPDQESDEMLLSAIAGAVGSAVFTASDLFTIHDATLQAALAGETTRTIGVRLRRLRRRPCGPYRVRRVARAGEGALWHLTTADV